MLLSKKPRLKAKLEVYKDRKGEFRWRVKAANGEKLSAASEGYARKADLFKAIRLTRDAMAHFLINEASHK